MPAAERLTDTRSIARKNLFPAERERGIYAVVEGGFAAGWFGWGQAAPPSWLVVPLAVGSILSVLVAVAGIVVTARSRARRTAVSDRTVRRRFRIIVLVEFALADKKQGPALRKPWPASARRFWRPPAEPRGYRHGCASWSVCTSSLSHVRWVTGLWHELGRC